jgi:hypothetical protein
MCFIIETCCREWRKERLQLTLYGKYKVGPRHLDVNPRWLWVAIGSIDRSMTGLLTLSRQLHAADAESVSCHLVILSIDFDELGCGIRGNLEKLCKSATALRMLKEQRQANVLISDKSTGK